MGAAGMERQVADLYARHGPRALRLAHLLTGDPTTAEDLVHDAFVRVLGRVRSIRESEAFGAYLTRTVVNLTKNHHRRADRARSYLAGHPASPSVTWQPDFEGRDELHRELLTLPYRQRAALVLRFCEDLPEAEVAALLHTSPKGVRSLVGRGLARLRNADGRNADG